MFHLSLVIQSLGVVKFSTKMVEYTISNSRSALRLIWLYTRRTVVRRELASGSPTPTLRRTFAGVRRSTAEFARVRPYSAANWRTVRQKIRSREEIPTTCDERYVRRVVRCERGSPRMKFAHGELQFTKKHILDGVNDRSPRTVVR